MVIGALLASSWSLVGCGASPDEPDLAVVGSGTPTSIERSVGRFDSVVAASDAVVTVDVGVGPYVTVTADDNLLHLISTDVADGELTIGVVDDASIRPTEPIHVAVGVPDLRTAVLAGSGDMTVRAVTGDLRGENAGSGDLEVAGDPDTLRLVVNGSGAIDASRVTTGAVDAEIHGSGSVLLGPADRLDARITGSGSVSYAGQPDVTSHIDGSGGVAPMTKPPPAPASTTEWPTVPAPALAGNLLDDRPELPVAVWLPPSYAVTHQRYPVVYFLAGYDEAASIAPVGAALDDAIAGGVVPEMIAVGVSGSNALGGSFYVDSPVTGGWATAIHRDLVDWIDTHYRTTATADERVIAGFSMGGFGAFDLAMRHPDVFGAVYALSPGALAPGALAETEMFAEDDAIESYLTMASARAAGEEAPALTEGARFALAYGSAFAPDVGAGPPWVDYPYSSADTPPDPDVWDVWEAGYGGIDDELAAHHDQLASLRGIALDVGTEDPYRWIPDGTAYLADALEAAGIDVTTTTHPGGHGPVGPRVAETMVPFLAGLFGTAESGG